MAEDFAPIEEKEAGMENDYIAQIQEMKKTHVSRDVYDKQLEENRRLLNALVSGEQLGQPAPEDSIIDYKEEWRKLVFSDEPKTNLDYVKKVLEIREAGLRQGENINMPFGAKAEYTDNDEAETEFIAQALQECVDKANGNPMAFNFYLSEKMVDNKAGAYNPNRYR